MTHVVDGEVLVLRGSQIQRAIQEKPKWRTIFRAVHEQINDETRASNTKCRALDARLHRNNRHAVNGAKTFRSPIHFRLIKIEAREFWHSVDERSLVSVENGAHETKGVGVTLAQTVAHD